MRSSAEQGDHFYGPTIIHEEDDDSSDQSTDFNFEVKCLNSRHVFDIKSTVLIVGEHGNCEKSKRSKDDSIKF